MSFCCLPLEHLYIYVEILQGVPDNNNTSHWQFPFPGESQKSHEKITNALKIVSTCMHCIVSIIVFTYFPNFL